MKIFIYTIVSLFAISSYSQKKYPSDYFRSPLDIPIVLAGTFGELRSNHFHAGLDIKTNQKEGLNVYAAADGYVSRIKVALWGYGKVIYVTHPNGYTTVYAHLSKFGAGIEEFVKKDQYKKENYETGNIFLKADQIPVKKGQIIAYSGSTGGFVAPHLHFEVRNTKTENIINPMLFGFLPEDSIPPKFKNLLIYPIEDSSRVNNSEKRASLQFKKIEPTIYSTSQVLASGRVGFGVDVYDQLNGAYNKNGIYGLTMYVNGYKMYQHELETFSFAKSKFINLLIDYPHYAKYNAKFQRLFKRPKNTLGIYKKLINNGYLDVKAGYNYNVEIVASDFNGNSTTIRIPIKGVKSNAIFKQAEDTTAYKIKADAFHRFDLKNASVAFPKNSFYKDVYLDLKEDKDVVTIHEPILPLDKSFTLTFDISKYSKEEVKQLYIANINNKKYPNYQSTTKKGSKAFTTSKTLGEYTLIIDNQNPTIKLKNFRNGSWLTNSKTLTVEISDVGSGIQSYRASIDGEWILMEYNLKKRLLTYDFSDKKLIETKHKFEIDVLDNVGNKSTLSATFYKKS